MTRLALALFLGSSLLGGCASAFRTLPLDAVASPSAARPAGVDAATTALATCAGQRFDPARVLLECDDDQQVFLIRYAAEPGGDVCRRLVGGNLRGVALAAGPALPLPARSETFAAGVRTPEPQRAGAVPERASVAACVPAAGGGALVALSVGGAEGAAARTLPPLAWDGLPHGLDRAGTPDSVDVFGRALAVHPSCQLLEPRNLQCPGDGQMSWSRFSTAGGAADAAEAHAERVRAQVRETFADERVACRFEGVETTCTRLVTTLPVGVLGRVLTAGQSLRLTLLVAAADVRGQHAQAECSFFDDQAAPGGLAALCAEAFEIDG